MNRNPQQVLQKWLLIFTGVVMAAFLFTFPTRDRRGMVDRIRLKVGAENLVSKRTLKEIAAEEKAAGKVRKPSNTSKFDPKAVARGHNTSADQQQRAIASVAFYCNKEYDRTSCAQWLNYCGESCKLLVQKDLWTKLASNPRSRGR